MKRLLIFVTLLTSVLALTACTAATVAPVTPTAVPSDTPLPTSTSTTIPTPSATPTPSTTPSPTTTPIPTPTITAISPGADADHTPVDNIFFAGFTDECEFPCWYGLQIDESDPEDVQRLFDDVFGFNGSLDFWAPHEGAAIGINLFFDTFPGLISTGYVWHDMDTKEHAGVAVYLSESTDLYQGLVVIWGGGSTTLFDDFVLSDIFQKLGTPSHILINGHTMNHTGGLLIEYDQGFVFHIFVGTKQSTEDAPKILCLGDTKFHEYSSVPGTMVITSPLKDRLDDLSEFEMVYFGRFIERDKLQPLNEFTDTTVDQLVQAILNGEDACIEVSTVE